MNRREFLGRTTGAVAATVLGKAAFSQPPTPPPLPLTPEVKVWGMPDGNAGAFWEQAVARFGKVHPDLPVQFEIAGDWWGGHLALLESVRQGKPQADIALLPSRWLGDYIAAQALEPLDDYAEDEFLEGFVDAPPLLAAHRYGGQLLALPAYVTVRPLLYNRRFMEQPPATWEELAKTGLAVASDPRVFALGLDTQGVEGANHFCSFLWSAGGDLLPEALAALPAGISHTLNSPAGMEALRFEHDLLCQHGVLHPHSLHVPRETIRQMFLEERVAMCCDTPAQAGAARAQGIPLGLAPFPQHRAPGTMAIADAFVLLRGARNKEAAWQFLRFLFADDTYRDYCHHFRKNPVRKVVLEDPSFRSEEAGQAEFLRLLPQSRVFPLHEKLQPLLEEIGKAVHRVLADGVDSQEALQITI